MQLLLNTVRKMDFDQAKEFTFGDNKSLEENLAIGLLNPDDLKHLNLTSHQNLKLRTEFGEVIVKYKEDDNVPLGTILLPVSIWANQITGMINNKLIFKNIEVIVEKTDEAILSFEEIIRKFKTN